MYDFDSYTLYEIKKRNVYSVRIKVILTEPVQEAVLRPAAEKAFRRFPYYARKVVVNGEGAYMVPANPSCSLKTGQRVVEA